MFGLGVGIYEDQFSFDYTHESGVKYEVEVTVLVEPRTVIDKMFASSDWEMEDHVSITDVVVRDGKGFVLTDSVEVDDEAILRAWSIEQVRREEQQEEDTLWSNW